MERLVSPLKVLAVLFAILWMLLSACDSPERTNPMDNAKFTINKNKWQATRVDVDGYSHTCAVCTSGEG
jgi:hypothetical protein